LSGEVKRISRKKEVTHLPYKIIIKLLKIGRPNIEDAIAIDASPTMLKSLREHFGNDPDVRMMEHDLNNPLSQLRADLGYFDAVVSSFAIHHLSHERKRSL